MPAADTVPTRSGLKRTGPDRLSGPVERVTFHNAENGYCVLRVKARGQRDLVTVVGYTAAIGAKAAGLWLNDRQHGLQFKADTIRTTMPTTMEGLEKYRVVCSNFA